MHCAQSAKHPLLRAQWAQQRGHSKSTSPPFVAINLTLHSASAPTDRESALLPTCVPVATSMLLYHLGWNPAGYPSHAGVSRCRWQLPIFPASARHSCRQVLGDGGPLWHMCGGGGLSIRLRRPGAWLMLLSLALHPFRCVKTGQSLQRAGHMKLTSGRENVIFFGRQGHADAMAAWHGTVTADVLTCNALPRLSRCNAWPLLDGWRGNVRACT